MKKRKRPVLHATIAKSIFGDKVFHFADDLHSLSLPAALQSAGFKFDDRVTIALSPDHSRSRRRGAR